MVPILALSFMQYLNFIGLFTPLYLKWDLYFALRYFGWDWTPVDRFELRRWLNFSWFAVTTEELRVEHFPVSHVLMLNVNKSVQNNEIKSIVLL